MSRRARSGEFELIARYFAPLAKGEPGALGLGDDAAVLGLAPGDNLVVTTDTLVAGVHFLDEDGPDAIARKLLRVNLSDLAAMGATPVAYTLNCALPEAIDDAWLETFAAGLGDDQRRFGLHLVGGDTVAIPGPLTLTVTAFGRVRKGSELRRSAAQAGDMVFVSGTIGDAALGLLALKNTLSDLRPEQRQALIGRYRLPEPRTALGPRLIGLAHAAIDVSDGLMADLGHICERSGLGATIDTGLVPLSEAAAAAVHSDPELLKTAITGGDDYELLFTAPAEAADALNRLGAEIGVPITAIGRIARGSGVKALGASGEEIRLRRPGYTHF